MENQEKSVDKFELRGQKMIILVGLIGSGKSTFAKALETHFSIKRCNQDDLGNRNRVEKLVIRSLSNGGSVCVDRTNINAGQRRIWLDIARTFSGVEVWVVTMNTPYEICAARLKERKDHPTIKSSAQGLMVLKRFSTDYEEASPLEDFDRMYDLDPHPTGDWSQEDVSKVLQEIDQSPSTRLPSGKDSSTADLALYVGLPLLIGATAAIGAHQIFSKSHSTG